MKLMAFLLHLYPRDFRARFGAEMCETFGAAYSVKRTAFRKGVFLAHCIYDAVLTASAEWRDVIRTSRPPLLMLSDVMYALRHAARTLVRNPGFAMSAILTLAVGIGATTAVFSVMSTALFEPLPYPDADRLVAISSIRRGQEFSLSYPDLTDLGARARTFESVAGFAGQALTLTDGANDPERVNGQIVTSNLFETLGVAPILGTRFTEADDAEHAPPVVAISHMLWTRKYGGNENIIGRAIILNGLPFTVSAVMPPGFRFPDGITYGPADAWVPASQIGSGDRNNRDNHPGIIGIGRLNAGATLDEGRAELASIGSDLQREYAATNSEKSFAGSRAIDAIVGSLANSLVLLFAAAIVVMLIACANVAGLLLTRAEARRREMAVKVALGADGFRVAANLAGEAAIIALTGGVGGAALAYTLVRAFATTVASLPRLDALTLDLRALAFAIGITLVVAFACSLAPMLWARRNAQGALTSRGTAGTLASRMRNAFVVGQVAMSLMLLIAASLLLRTFNEMTSVTGGIRPEGVVTFALALPAARYTDEPSRAAFAHELTTRLAAQPGASGAALVSTLPFGGSGSQSGVAPHGGTRDDERRTDVAAVTPDYFRTMGIELKRGRVFTNADDGRATPVVVIDELFANAVWPGEDPIGKRVQGWGKGDWQIIGVVGHVKNYGVAATSRQEMYAPFAQRATFRLNVVVRTTAEPGVAIAAARGLVKELDPQLAIYNARTMGDVVNRTVAGPRLAAFLSAGYALTALLVVVIGIHGAISYLVHRRTREIGVRVALGASRPSVLRLVASLSLRLTGLGILIGVTGGIAATRLIRDQLFGVSPNDISTYVIAGGAMAVVGLAASAMPAWRALKVSPLLALSED